MADHGAPPEVPTVVQPPPPTGRRWKVTCVVSPLAPAESLTEPLTFPGRPASETVGAKLSTVTPTEPVPVELPATSVITAEIEAESSPVAAEFQPT